MNQPIARIKVIHDHALQQAGLQECVHATAGLVMSLLTGVTLLRLHSLQPVTELNEALRDSGIHLPGQVNQATGHEPSALCLAPADWLLFSECPADTQLYSRLEAAINPRLTALLDQSAAYAVFRLDGAIAPWLLSKCAGLDWRRGVLSGQHCARTLLERVPVILHYQQPGRSAGPFVVDVMVERSLARQTWQMLLGKLPHALELEQQHGPF